MGVTKGPSSLHQPRLRNWDYESSETLQTRMTLSTVDGLGLWSKLRQCWIFCFIRWAFVREVEDSYANTGCRNDMVNRTQDHPMLLFEGKRG